MAGKHYYYYDHEACTFIAIKSGREKIFTRIATTLFLAIGAVLLLGWVTEAGQKKSEENDILSENAALKEQLSYLDKRIARITSRLDQLSKTDQNLYRALLEAEPIPEDVRQVGVGGTKPIQFSRFGSTTALLLNTTSRQLDKIERQINLQNESYRDLSKLIEKRPEWLAQLPAIIPCEGQLVSGFGVRRDPILRVSKRHEGVDIVARTGTPVYSTAAGEVSFAAFSAGLGRHVIIKHATSGYETVYAHLSAIESGIHPGVRIERGQKLGLSGSSGRSTGPHLHYEVHDSKGTPLNPITFFAPSMTPRRYQTLLKAASKSTIALD